MERIRKDRMGLESLKFEDTMSKRGGGNKHVLLSNLSRFLLRAPCGKSDKDLNYMKEETNEKQSSVWRVGGDGGKEMQHTTRHEKVCDAH